MINRSAPRALTILTVGAVDAATAVFVLFLMMAPESARAACDLAGGQPIVSIAAEEWVDLLPSRLSDSLEKRGFAFPEVGFIKECPGMIPALLVIERPAEEVFEQVIQTERHGEFMDSVGSVSPVSRSPGNHVDRYEMKVLFVRIAYYVRHAWSADSRRVWWGLSPDYSNDLRKVKGFWEIHPLDEHRSLAIYATTVDVGPIIPRSLQASLTRRNFRSIVGDARAWLQSDRGSGE